MNLWVRLVWSFFRAHFGKKIGFQEESKISFMVLPNDLDVYRHMNNSRYLALMDLGRMDLVWRSPLGRAAQQHGWFPIVAAIDIQYKKSLKLFQPFSLHTRIISWDEKWFFLEQRFQRKGKVMAIATVKGLFRGAQGNVSTENILKSINFNKI